MGWIPVTNDGLRSCEHRHGVGVNNGVKRGSEAECRLNFALRNQSTKTAVCKCLPCVSSALHFWMLALALLFTRARTAIAGSVGAASSQRHRHAKAEEEGSPRARAGRGDHYQGIRAGRASATTLSHPYSRARGCSRVARQLVSLCSTERGSQNGSPGSI